MIDTERLKQFRKQAITSVELRLEGAQKGHGSTVTNETIGSFDLIEMTSELLNFREKYGEFEGIKDK